MSELQIARLGERAFTVRFPNDNGQIANRRALILADLVRSRFAERIDDVYCSYNSLSLFMASAAFNEPQVLAEIKKLAAEIPAIPDEQDGAEVEISVRYDGEDLPKISQHAGLTVDEVIKIHSETTYLVYAVGFTPGFPFMGYVDPRIVMPRLTTPRARVPAGSVAIAGGQTGIYPIESPGGWNIVGTTDINLFDLKCDPPALLQAGSKVRFVPV